MKLDLRLLFDQSKVNGGHYYGDPLEPMGNWTWPKGTWMQNRLVELKMREAAGAASDRD